MDSTEATPLLGAATDAPNSPLSDPPAAGGARSVQVYLGLLALVSFPLAASQVATYDLLYDVVCRHLSVGADQCTDDPRATRAVADLLSAASLVLAVVATGTLAIVASLSDRLGRKWGIVWNLAFATLAVGALPLLAYAVPARASPWRMLLAFVLSALSGTPSLTLNLSVLYLSDCLPDPRARTQYLSVMLGVFMLIQAVAPGVGSMWLRAGIPVGTYISACAVLMAAGTAVFAVLIPSKPRDGDANVRAHLRQFLERAVATVAFRNCESRTQRRNAWVLLVNFFLSNEFAVGFIDVLVVYAKRRFGWQVAQIGPVLATLFSIRCAWALAGFPVVYALLCRKWVPRPTQVDWPDLVHMVASSLLTLGGYVLLAAARSSTQYTVGIITLANDGIAGPIWVNALLKHVDEGRRGDFLAALGLFIKPLGAVLPAALLKIFELTIDTNVVFLVVIAMATLATASLALLKVQN